MEEWRVIKDFPDYEVSDLGRVRSKDRYIWQNFAHGYKQRFCKSSIIKPLNAKGYRRVGLYHGNGKELFSVHRLVAEAFINNPQNKRVVNHKNGIKDDNRLSNLEWCTDSENCIHALKTGLRKAQKGSKSSRAKLTESDVILIRKLYNEYKIKQEIIGVIFGLKRGTVSSITTRKNWSHI